MTKITILTRRVSIKAFLKKGIRNILRFLRTFLKTGIIDFDIFIYCGHTAVTKSLIKGIKETGIKFSFNPFFLRKISDTVVVLSDVGALKQAISWKKRGVIKKLLAGPNILEIPTKYNNILLSPEIDKVLVPSEMTVEIYEKLNPTLKGKVVIWYSGIDEKYWVPKDLPKEKEILVYWKNFSTAFNLEVESVLKNKGYKISRVVYGFYKKSTFKKLLEKSVFAVFLSVTETQGLALAEAWAMDVPTLVWDPEIEHYYLRNIKTTSAPYLTDKTGIRWKELDELEQLLSNNKLNLNKFSPRKWIQKNMTNKNSAEMLIKICDDLANK